MRIIKYKNEKQCTCEHCHTVIGYDPKRDINGKRGEDSVGGVYGFLKTLTVDERNQLDINQFNLLKSHKDWVLYVEYHSDILICPVCGKEISLGNIFDTIEIYPEQEATDNGEFDNVIYVL